MVSERILIFIFFKDGMFFSLGRMVGTISGVFFFVLINLDVVLGLFLILGFAGGFY